MKLRFLLLSLFITGILHAQVVCDYPEGVITSLIISEASFVSAANAYVEITNMGNEPVRLSEFKFGRLTPWSATGSILDLCNDSWQVTSSPYLFLPDRMLNPGESYVITAAYDYGPRHYKMGAGRLGGSERPKQVGLYEVADKLIHMAEPVSEVHYEGDSVTTAYNDPEQLTRRGDYSRLFADLLGGTMYLEHHYTVGDSAVIDQIGGVFDAGTGRNISRMAYDIAGVEGGVNSSILVRRATVPSGNIDFASGRGISLEDSEWMPIQLPSGYNSWRDVFWTIGNHGNFILNENTLESENPDITIDFALKKITVPWGTMRLDEIMRNMKKKPGVAWRYDLNPLQEDSLYRSARTGDQLTIYVVGNALQSATFEIEVREPTADDNIVIPIDHPVIRVPGTTGPITTRAQNGILSWPRVTRHESGVDTITGSAFGLSFDLRSDSLVKYLEKPAGATWEFVWVDNTLRPDLKNGDKLKVTSLSGKIKEYFIQVQSIWPSTNADLASITWPDIPGFYRGVFGWTGDTIPNFSPGGMNYRVEIPVDIEGVPALKAKTSHVNASVKVTRARSLTGTVADRTVTFEVTAENDTVQKTYKVELVKEKRPDKIEPLVLDPFFSEFVNSYPTGHVWVEIFNPGNQPLDLRNYMIGFASHASIYRPITNPQSNWVYRYGSYIPGLKYVDEATWAATRYIMEPHPNVNPIIPGGGTFIFGNAARGNDQNEGIEDYFPDWDVQFSNQVVPNSFNEHVQGSSTRGWPYPSNGNRQNFFALYKVLNDSIKLGLKPPTDVNDFEVIDVWGMPDRGHWIVGGYRPGTGEIFIRKPSVIKGNPEFAGSFGTDEETSEWIRIMPGDDFGHIPTPERYGVAWSSLKNHFMIEPTFFKSTVNSSVYKVSDGFGPGEEILGVKTGTTVADFLSSINKEDEGQTLMVTSSVDGSEPGMDAVLNMSDLLTVISADSANTTVYRLDVTETGLSNDAYLTSNRWTIDVTVAPKSAGNASAEEDGVGFVSNFDYGTTIKTIVNNVTVPAGATLTVIDGDGAYVPFTELNFDTTYVSVTVNPDIYLDVVAEDNVTRILYQLQPNTSSRDAFILSDIYSVSQIDNLIHFVPRGTNFQAFLANIIPSFGASLKLVDKMGFERVQGNIREDDKVVVTSANGEVTRVYFISFLSTATIPTTTYLAYVLSNAYSVNQVDYMISEGIAPLTGQTLLSEFLSYIIPSMGASVVVVDKDGNEKSTGDLDDGDMLKVTSADGKIVTMYHLALDLTSADRIGVQQQIEIYPNPTTGRLNISGVEAGDRIRIYSAAGAVIRDTKALSNLEVLSLDDVPSGMFLIVISNDNRMLGRFKAIKSHSK